MKRLDEFRSKNEPTATSKQSIRKAFLTGLELYSIELLSPRNEESWELSIVSLRNLSLLLSIC